MNKIAQIEKVVIINNVNDILTVSTTQIAEHFEKQHKDVIKATENLIKETSAQNFANLFYRVHTLINTAGRRNHTNVQETASRFWLWALQEKRRLNGS